MARRSWVRRRRFPVVPLLILALVIAAVATTRPGDRGLYPAAPGAPATTIYLVDNGFHTDLVAPRAVLTARSRPIAQAAAATTDKPWVVIGWGDATFYTTRGVSGARALDGLRALFAPNNPSVVRLEGLGRSPDQVWRSGVRPIRLSNAGLEMMLRRVDRSFAPGADGQPARATTAAQADMAFFRGAEPFSLIHLCNHWTAEALNAAGLPVTLLIDTVPAGLMLDLRARAWLADHSRL